MYHFIYQRKQERRNYQAKLSWYQRPRITYSCVWIVGLFSDLSHRRSCLMQSSGRLQIISWFIVTSGRSLCLRHRWFSVLLVGIIFVLLFWEIEFFGFASQASLILNSSCRCHQADSSLSSGRSTFVSSPLHLASSLFVGCVVWCYFF